MWQDRDEAAKQLSRHLANLEKSMHDKAVLTTAAGIPVENKNDVLTIGPRGPLLMQDVIFMDEMAHFDRERIPERVVHAKGAGGESGSADTARDPRGFAVKFYSEAGNFDLVGNNTPIFFVRDPFLFPSFIHTQKRNPMTHLKDPDMFWDFITLRPETTHQVMFLFSDRGTPSGYRHMNGYGSHAFKFVNSSGDAVYCKFHLKTDQGIKNLSAAEADSLASSDPDYSTRDLYNSIEAGLFPTWTFCVQIMTFEQAEVFQFNPFDVTKVWPHSKFPLIPVGKIILNRNPSNYFAEVEQSAFNPANFIPGIEASPDKMLQGRLFAYADTQFHRLGPNHKQLPVNCPYKTKIANYQRDGGQTLLHQGGAPNYYPNSFGGPVGNASAAQHKFGCKGDVQRYNSADDDNFSQPKIFWTEVLSPKDRQNLIDNIANHLANSQDSIQQRAINMFTQVHPDFGQNLARGLKADKLNKKAKL